LVNHWLRVPRLLSLRLRLIIGRMRFGNGGPEAGTDSVLGDFVLRPRVHALLLGVAEQFPIQVARQSGPKVNECLPVLAGRTSDPARPEGRPQIRRSTSGRGRVLLVVLPRLGSLSSERAAPPGRKEHMGTRPPRSGLFPAGNKQPLLHGVIRNDPDDYTPADLHFCQPRRSADRLRVAQVPLGHEDWPYFYAFQALILSSRVGTFCVHSRGHQARLDAG